MLSTLWTCSFVRPSVCAKNLDHLYAGIYAFMNHGKTHQTNPIAPWDPPLTPKNPLAPLINPLGPLNSFLGLSRSLRLPKQNIKGPIKLILCDILHLPLDPLGPCRPTLWPHGWKSGIALISNRLLHCVAHELSPARHHWLVSVVCQTRRTARLSQRRSDMLEFVKEKN